MGFTDEAMKIGKSVHVISSIHLYVPTGERVRAVLVSGKVFFLDREKNEEDE